MRSLGIIMSVIVAAWLQVSWFGHLRPLGVIPNVVMIVVVLCGVWLNATPTIAAAVGGGLLIDMAAGDHHFGLRMACYVVMALAIVAGRQLGLQAQSVVTALLAMIVGTSIYNLAILATLKAPLSSLVVGRIGAELAVNCALLLLLFIIRANIGTQTQTSLELGPGVGK